MKLQSLIVKKRESYEKDAGQLYGHVEMADEDGNAVKVNLSPTALSRIIKAIGAEVVKSIQYTADSAKQAVRDAVVSGPLLENASNLLEAASQEVSDDVSF